MNDAKATNISTDDELLNEMERLFASGQWNETASARFRQEAEKLCAIDESCGEALKGVAAAYDKNLSEVEKRFERALTLNPDNKKILVNYGKCLFENGDFSGAVQILAPFVNDDKMIALTAGLAANRLGLSGIADHCFALAGCVPAAEEMARLCSMPDAPYVAAGAQALEESIVRDCDIWKSLSNR